MGTGLSDAESETPQAAEVSRLLSLNLGTFRVRAGLSQQGTAERAGLNRVHIGLIEGGKRLPRLDTIVKFAGAVEFGTPRFP